MSRTRSARCKAARQAIAASSDFQTAAQGRFSQVTSDELKSWIGRSEHRCEILDVSRSRALAATIAPDEEIQPGSTLPPGWHWLFFNAFVPMSEVGADGHPRRGGFLPPVELPRRMWAGGEIKFLEHLRAGEEATRESEIVSIEEKSGRQGALVFVNVRHRVVQRSRLAIEEVQNIVYRNPPSPGAPRASAPIESPANPELLQVPFRADEVMLFRYSALTFNGHRIHYDKPYVTEEEGYPDLVVHGPLTATMLMQTASRAAPPAPRDQPHLRRFAYRGVSPLFVHEAATLVARREPDASLALSARKTDGTEVMTAQAELRA